MKEQNFKIIVHYKNGLSRHYNITDTQENFMKSMDTVLEVVRQVFTKGVDGHITIPESCGTLNIINVGEVVEISFEGVNFSDNED